MKKLSMYLVMAILLFAGCTQDLSWKQQLQQDIKQLGHRNWVVVVDEAYPLQNSNGISMTKSDLGHLETITFVNDLIEKQGHVRSLIYLDKELGYVKEERAEGVSAFRKSLSDVFKNNSPKIMLHDNIIKMLGEAAKDFNVVVIKTDFKMPYTSVFFQLDCKIR